MSKVKVGIIGCGDITPAYVKGCRQFEILDVVACADVESDRARSLAREHDLQAVTVPVLLEDPNIGVIINLTVPAAHAADLLAAIAAGKHVHSEKPLATTARTEGQSWRQPAGAYALAAPRHLSRRRLTTCRQLLDEGRIGEPVSSNSIDECTAWILAPDPARFYQHGAGGVLRYGACLSDRRWWNLLGPARRVTSMANISLPPRRLVTGPAARWRAHRGQHTDTHINRLIELSRGHHHDHHQF